MSEPDEPTLGIHLECDGHALHQLAYDAAYMVRATLAAGPLDPHGLAQAIGVSIMVAMYARDPSSSKHEQCFAAVEAAREVNRRTSPKGDA